MPRTVHSYWIAGRLWCNRLWKVGWTEVKWKTENRQVWNGEDLCACAVAGEHVWEFTLVFSSGIPRNSVCVLIANTLLVFSHNSVIYWNCKESTLGTYDFLLATESNLHLRPVWESSVHCYIIMILIWGTFIDNVKEMNTYRLGTRRNDGRGERTYINKKGVGVDWGGGGGGGR